MKPKLLIVVDLGCLKAYHVEQDELSSNPRLVLLETFHTAEAHRRLSDRFTDEAGRFAGGSLGGKGVHAYGERHNIQLESNKRTVKTLAGRVTELVRREEPDVPVFLAADREIQRQILEQLAADVSPRIERVVSSDLTRADGKALLNHFAVR